jgi:hypothetical protein
MDKPEFPTSQALPPQAILDVHLVLVAIDIPVILRQIYH